MFFNYFPRFHHPCFLFFVVCTAVSGRLRLVSTSLRPRLSPLEWLSYQLRPPFLCFLSRRRRAAHSAPQGLLCKTRKFSAYPKRSKRGLRSPRPCLTRPVFSWKSEMSSAGRRSDLPPKSDLRRARESAPRSRISRQAEGASASSPEYALPPAWQQRSLPLDSDSASSSFPFSSPSASPFFGESQRMQAAHQVPSRDRGDRVRQLEGECLDSLQSSLRVVAETNEVSQRTAVQLDAQSEQLRGIKDTTDDIKANLQTSDYLLKGMKTWWGSFTQLFTSPPSQKVSSSSEGKKSVTQRDRENLPEWEREHREQDAQEERRRQRLIQAHRARTTDFDTRLEGDLEKLSVMLEELHGRAVQMNGALQEQNNLLDEINQNVDANQQTLERQRKTMQKIIKKG
ncbi:putative SNARE domain protein [Toxoplasma gondii FOU]|uniref:Putative SNARE domain protein n=1 Tax=Toxoplasma gondii FOU TaxID=943167 RepID=A0A086KGT2_TOXGO|nr:putative SNARE domain protein [Toxoplasma gondii FOU]